MEDKLARFRTERNDGRVHSIDRNGLPKCGTALRPLLGTYGIPTCLECLQVRAPEEATRASSERKTVYHGHPGVPAEPAPTRDEPSNVGTDIIGALADDDESNPLDFTTWMGFGRELRALAVLVMMRATACVRHVRACVRANSRHALPRRTQPE